MLFLPMLCSAMLLRPGPRFVFSSYSADTSGEQAKRVELLAMELLRSVVALLLLLAVLLGQSATAESKGARPITDSEVRSRKVKCLEEINNGMWGSRCKASPIDRENCALRCVSAACYHLLYADDPLEEGEVEFHRGRDFRMCVRRESKGLPLSLESLYD